MSFYYLMYAIHHGIPHLLAEQIIAITLAAVTVSIVLHGISVRPLMHLYWRHEKCGRNLQAGGEHNEKQPSES
jgi:NhaP-type Na+/H+ or K+/H+ antiporter